ncbi:MAG TPA: GNAT family N-acetyltransferase [Acetobacteraceae bacterium]|nr:GNAT family N-acetyltransferase [Acetobacteraceae bacterium]
MPALAAIHAAAFPPNEVWGEDAISLQLALPGGFGWLDERGGMLLGRVTVDEAEVLTLAVAPHVRRQGIASLLMGAACKETLLRGGRSIFLEVAEGNVPARNLYARFGFIEVGRRPRYYPNQADALVLRMNIS